MSKETQDELRPVLLENPEHCPGAYDMHFYCKYRNRAHPHRMNSWHGAPYLMESEQCETRGEALAQARSMGWIYHRDGTATCPLCAAALRARAAKPPSGASHD